MEKERKEHLATISIAVGGLILFIIALYINFKGGFKLKQDYKTDDVYVNSEKSKELDKEYNSKYNLSCKLIPTYENCSYYYTCDKVKSAQVFYKKKGDSLYKKTYQPVLSQDSGYKGSIVGLNENTEYNVVIELYDDNGKLLCRKMNKVTTLSSKVEVGKTVKLSDIVKDDKSIKGLYIDNVSGSNDSWIKVLVDIDIIDANSDEKSYRINTNDKKIVSDTMDSSNKNNAVEINNCKYLIFENAVIRGGKKNSIYVNNSSNIQIKACDIADYGRSADKLNENKVGLDSKNEVINYDSGICLESSSKLLVEGNYVHSPKGNANAWSKDYDSKTHPMGPNALFLKTKHGENVIRYNSFIGNDEHRFNDVIEGWNNSSKEGGCVKDTDIYGNTLAYSNDDGVELDGGQENVRFYNNRISNTMTGVSIAPNLSGPSYIYRNEIVDLSDIEDKTNYAIKSCGGLKGDYGISFIFNNTFVTKGAVYGFYSKEDKQADIVSRNNIIYSKEKETFDNECDIDSYDIDYDLLYSEKDKYFKKDSDIYEKNAIINQPSFSNADIGLYGLDKNSNAVDKGVVLYGFTDGYNKNAPDIGAYEIDDKKSTIGMKKSIKTDCINIDLSKNSKSVFDINVDKINNIDKVKALLSDENKWFNVSVKEGDKKNTIRCSVELSNIISTINKGAFVIKLDNNDLITIFVKK